ncbi:MAG: RNA-guided endonuclease InsQ/TnpB family protein [Candidatus Bipolaricaulia bacterium]
MSLRRTIKRYSRSLNQGKWQTVHQIAAAYVAQKDRFLVEYGRPSIFARYQNHHQVRDELLATGYQSPFGLQARMWKLALQDAIETIDRQWLALAEALRPLVMAQKNRDHFTDEQARYAFWVLKSSRHMAQLVSGRAPSPLHFSISRREQRQVVAYLRRVIRRKRGKDPRVGQVRSFALDAEMYRVFEQNGRQYISIMTLTPGRRLILPLTGWGTIQGNLRIVRDEEKRRIEVHRAIEVKPEPVTDGSKVKAVDLGVTEVMTDSDGDRWGEGLGQRLANYSDQICDKGRKRNKLGALARRAEEKGDKAKARRIRKYNLGREKQRKQRRKMRQTLANEINRALNAFWKAKGPAVVVHENLRYLNGKWKSRRLSRIVSLWVRGLIKDRVAFKASAGGSHHEQVNASYSSQTCPHCGFVHRQNRRGNRFQCLFCGHGGDSDAVAALNLLDRWHDSEILLWTPKERVRAVLESRFRRRLERWAFDFPPQQVNLAVLAEVGIEGPSTVPGRTRDTRPTAPLVDKGRDPAGQSESETPLAAIRQRTERGHI